MAYDVNKLSKLSDLKALAERVNAVKADKATTLAGYGITNAYTKDETVAQINSKIGSAYKAGGSYQFADLPAVAAALTGMVYNITDAFVTTSSFVEGAGKSYPPGTNVVVVEIPAQNGEGDPTYAYDVLSGFIDTSIFVEKEEGKRLMTDEEGTKLAGISEGANKVEASTTIGNIKIDGTETQIFAVTTDAEVTEMLNEVYGETA